MKISLVYGHNPNMSGLTAAGGGLLLVVRRGAAAHFLGKRERAKIICLRIRFESVALPEVHSFLRPTMPTACCPGRSWSQTDIFHHQKWYEHPTTPMFRGFDQVWAPNPRVAPHHHQEQTVLRRRARVQALCSIQAANAVEIHTL